jgi:hypothetical protein
MVTAKDGAVTLNVKVLAPQWVPLDEVSIFANGERVGVFKTGRNQIGSFRPKIPIPVNARGSYWATTSNSPDTQIPVPPGDYTTSWRSVCAAGIHQPIFVDVDGNGRYDARHTFLPGS